MTTLLTKTPILRLNWLDSFTAPYYTVAFPHTLYVDAFVTKRGVGAWGGANRRSLSVVAWFFFFFDRHALLLYCVGAQGCAACQICSSVSGDPTLFYQSPRPRISLSFVFLRFIFVYRMLCPLPIFLTVNLFRLAHSAAFIFSRLGFTRMVLLF
jgi:hypothetical protein